MIPGEYHLCNAFSTNKRVSDTEIIIIPKKIIIIPPQVPLTERTETPEGDSEKGLEKYVYITWYPRVK
ncbi:hypothetical protein E2C01_076202 [Portunus trituberculatus]|uniref:Uncharacterized protein n=1 Tax=Portunus trituberculatus TaxID=210409 RepID=A0A5B7IJ80_PORTR|nr:hypothetical protein [Portunus trituberculatus]